MRSQNTGIQSLTETNPMKKYRVTSLHPVLKEGSILTYEKTIHGVPSCSLTTANGEPIPIAFMYDLRVESNPTWYEEVKPERWMPKIGSVYHYVKPDFSTTATWNYGEVGSDLFAAYNCFETEKQAEEAARRMKEVLIAYQDELINE